MNRFFGWCELIILAGVGVIIGAVIEDVCRNGSDLSYKRLISWMPLIITARILAAPLQAVYFAKERLYGRSEGKQG